MTRCIAILALALTSTLFADQSSAEDGWEGDLPGPSTWVIHFEVVVDTIGSPGSLTLSDNQSGFSPDYILLLDMGFSPEEADYILLLGFDAFDVNWSSFLDGHVEEFTMKIDDVQIDDWATRYGFTSAE